MATDGGWLMSRQYGRVKTSIWGDDDFRQLTDPAQSLYQRLLSQPSMNLCGVCDWRPKRLALLTRGMTVAKVNEAAAELIKNRYIVVDEESDEVLVRTFAKHEGVIVNPKTAAGLEGAFARVVSPKLRSVVADELRRLRVSEPNLKGWVCLSKALAYGTDNLSHGLSSHLSEEVSDSVPIPLKPETLNQEPEEKSMPRKRGCRLPDGWEPDQHVWDQMAEQFPQVNLKAAHEKFSDYWQAKAGRDATKLDWNGTWRNWIRTEAERSPNSRLNGNTQPVPAYEPVPLPESVPWAS